MTTSSNRGEQTIPANMMVNNAKLWLIRVDNKKVKRWFLICAYTDVQTHSWNIIREPVEHVVEPQLATRILTLLKWLQYWLIDDK